MRLSFLIISVSFAAGILLSTLKGVNVTMLIFAIGILLILLMCSRRVVVGFVISVCLFVFLGFLFSLSRGAKDSYDVSRLAKYYRQKQVLARGEVVSDIRRGKLFGRNKYSFTFKLNELKAPWGWEKASGKVLVNSFAEFDYEFGQETEIQGKLHRPFNFSDTGFSYPKYLQNYGIDYVLSVKSDSVVTIISQSKGSLKSFSFSVRQDLLNIFDKHLTPSEAGIMKAIILGDRTGIPKHVRTLFERTGTVHILAISGLHIGIIVGIIVLVLKLLRFPRKWMLVLSISLLVFYVFLTGMRPSVLRASMMAVILMIGLLTEKESSSLNTLGFAGFILLLINPFYLFDVGFQLSFMCVFFILICARPIYKTLENLNLHRIKIVNLVNQSLSVSIAVWIGIVGIIAYYFHIITPITILANLFIVPLLGVIVVLGFILLVVAGLGLPIVVSVSMCIKIVLNLMTAIIFLLAKLPGAYVMIDNISFWETMIYYIFLAVLLLAIRAFSYKKDSRTHLINNNYISHNI